MGGSAEDDSAGGALFDLLLWPLMFIVAVAAMFYGNFEPMKKLFGLNAPADDGKRDIGFEEDA